ncbi:hypothetical protein E2C01_037532 [Portunus trituberculatus]|uniref:Uncharacterized protein n=1 Tax=Portunus trituberculatus TaxID=210409 RepID=A0A5B7FFW6_PORTR|nr:hypothetical protein [Portunus trituberculatus]
MYGPLRPHTLVTEDVYHCIVLSQHKPRVKRDRVVLVSLENVPRQTRQRLRPSTTEGTESVPGRLGPASPGKPDDPGVTFIGILNRLTLSGDMKTRALTESSIMPSYSFLQLGTRQRRGMQKGENIPITQSFHNPLSCPNLHPLSPVLLQASAHRYRRTNYFPTEIYPGHGILHCENPWPERKAEDLGTGADEEALGNNLVCPFTLLPRGAEAEPRKEEANHCTTEESTCC